jgi:hypothetical protein
MLILPCAINLEIHFKKSVLDFSKFYALNMKGTHIYGCLVAVDFMATDITDVLWQLRLVSIWIWQSNC